MFVVSKKASYVWPVVYEYPGDGAKYEKATFDAEFKRIPQSRLQEIQKQIEDSSLSSDVELAKEILVGWKGVQDENGEVPFSELARDAILENLGLASAIVKAFFASITGAPRKN